jgi:hypothetical protein
MKAAKSPQSEYDRELIVLLHTLGERLAGEGWPFYMSEHMRKM